jgi:hypothetical protein
MITVKFQQRFNIYSQEEESDIRLQSDNLDKILSFLETQGFLYIRENFNDYYLYPKGGGKNIYFKFRMKNGKLGYELSSENRHLCQTHEIQEIIDILRNPPERVEYLPPNI